MNKLNLVYGFLGGAIVGAAAAILFAPASGEDVREKICKTLKRKGVKISDSEVDKLVAELAGAIEK